MVELTFDGGIGEIEHPVGRESIPQEDTTFDLDTVCIKGVFSLLHRRGEVYDRFLLQARRYGASACFGARGGGCWCA